jgi:hypothetical protein
MKTIYLLIITLCVLTSTQLLGRIKNGYEPKIESSRIALRELRILFAENKNMSMTQRLRVKSAIDNLINYISYYELTEELIHQLRMVSPGIFLEMDNIKDKRGRPTDVYVKLIPKEKARVNLEAVSFFEQALTDEDANNSMYGDYSVSVDIWIGNSALFLFCHELGHIKYIVPNIATYSKFYKKHYPKNKVEVSYIGHKTFDQSGKHAILFEKRFLGDKKAYFQNNNKKTESLFVLLARIRKNIRNNNEIVNPVSTIVSNQW